MDYPTWNEIEGLLGVTFKDLVNSFGDKPIEQENNPIYSNIDVNIIKDFNAKTPCGIDIPVLLKPELETKQPLIVILGESALRNQKELAEIEKTDANVILGTPYAIHLKECPPKCGVYRKIFDAILEKGYPIYITDIIKIWCAGKKDSLLKPNDKDIEVFNKELDILKKEINNNIIIVAWGETAQNGLEEVRKDSKDVLPSLSLPHPGQRNWAAWKLRIFEKAVFSKNLEYATRLYGEDPNGDENKTTAEKVAIEAVKSIDDYINNKNNYIMAFKLNSKTAKQFIENENNIIFFESDDEFTDFCIAPYAVVKRSSDGTLFVEGQYSDMYKKYIEQGKTFIIKDENSQVYKRQCVSKRVPVKIDDFPSYDRLTLVQLPVQNLEPYFEDLEDM
jgi:hypothetical protein